MKRFLTYILIGSLFWNNVALATHQILELDFKDSQTPQRLHVIPRMSNVGDVSHLEIDTEQKQAAVYLKEKHSSQGGDVPVTTKPVILQKHDIINLPWELEPEKLTLFILNHTAWLTPLNEDGYKLEFRGQLLGGMMKGGGGKKELVIDVTKFTVDCKGRNDFPSGTVGEKFCNKAGNGSGGSGVTVINVSGTGGGGVSKGTSSGGSGWQSILGKGWAEIEANGDKAKDRMQQQQENLKKLNTANQPFEIYKRKDIIPHNPFPRIQPPQPVQPLPKDWEGKVAMIDQGFFRLSWNEMYHLARKLGVPDQVITDWRNYRASHDEVSLVSYLETKRKLEIEQAEKAKKVLQQKINSGEFFKDQIIGHLHPSQTKGITILKNQNGVVSVYVPFIGLTYPVSESDMDKKGAFLPTGYVITPHAEYLVNETGKILTKGNGIPSTENAVSIAYLVTGLLQEVLEDTARSSQSIYTKDGFEKRLKEATRLHHNLSGITFPKKPGGMDSETFMTTFLLKLVQNMAFSLGGSSKSLTVTSVPGFFSQGLNANNDLSLFSALTQLHYPVFKEDREKSGIFLPKNYEVTPHADYLVTETAKIVERNHISDTGGVVAFAYVTNNTLREVLEEAARSSTAVYTKDGFNQRLREAFLLHHQYSGNQSLPKVGGVAGMDAQVFMIQELMPRLAGMALGLGGSSKTLLLSNFPGLSQSFNGNGDVSIYSAFTNLHYPVFAEDRGTTGSLLPITYKPTKESDYLIKYTKGYVVDANKIKHQVEELQAIGYLVHEAMEQAVEDCRNGDAWDQQEFYTCLKGMTLHHLQMSGAEWVNTKMGGYFTEQLLPRIIYQAAFHHARIPANKKPFDDQVMQDWLKTDWTGLVKQVGKMQKTDPMSPYDFFDLEGKMGGVGLMAGGAGGGKLGLNRLRGIQNFKNAPPVLQRQPNFQWTVKEANVAPRIGQHPKFGKICKDPTQKVGNKEIWWSKDTAKHGGSNYKLFEEKSDHFSWIGDVDAAGKVVLKHKSEIGKYIFKKEINWIK